MAGPSADHIAEWEGGSLSELVAMLQAAALPVRIEVIAPGTTDSSAGEVHLLAGGMADAFAGSLRRDDAMAALQRLEGARYIIECRLPNPESGSLSEPGPHDGNLKDRPLASLMRYCEDYVLTCRLEVWRGQDRAVISYQRGEIIGTIVGGGEGSDRLPEVLAWNDGAYEIILPAPVLPQMPSRGRDGVGARAERKRHTTLPMIPGSEAKLDVQGGSQTESSAKSPIALASATTAAPSGTVAARAVASGAVTAPPPRPGLSQPAQPAIPTGSPRVSPPSTASRPAPQPTPQAAGRPPLLQVPVAHKIPAQQPTPAAITPKPAAVTFASSLQPEMTTRGTPPVPAVPLVPARAPQPSVRPTSQGTGVPWVPPKPATTAQTKAVAPASLPAPHASPKPAAVLSAPQPPPKPGAPSSAPQPPPKPGASPSAPLPLQKPAAAQPVPLTPQKVAPTQAPQPLQKPPAVPLSAQPAAQPPAQPASKTEKPQAAPARPSKPAPPPPISNDLLPASGTIEAKPQHGNYLPPTTPPIQIADEPQMASTEPPPTPVLAQSQPLSTPELARSRPPKRTHAAAHKGSGERPVRTYVFLGLAIGVGIVLAYWAYWYLPFGHH